MQKKKKTQTKKKPKQTNTYSPKKPFLIFSLKETNSLPTSLRRNDPQAQLTKSQLNQDCCFRNFYKVSVTDISSATSELKRKCILASLTVNFYCLNNLRFFKRHVSQFL